MSTQASAGRNRREVWSAARFCSASTRLPSSGESGRERPSAHSASSVGLRTGGRRAAAARITPRGPSALARARAVGGARRSRASDCSWKSLERARHPGRREGPRPGGGPRIGRPGQRRRRRTGTGGGAGDGDGSRRATSARPAVDWVRRRVAAKSPARARPAASAMNARRRPLTSARGQFPESVRPRTDLHDVGAGGEPLGAEVGDHWPPLELKTVWLGGGGRSAGGPGRP